MIAWMITIDTPRGTADTEESLLAFTHALDEAVGAPGAVTSVNVKTGVLGATLTVEAEDVRRAVDDAVSAFDRALEQAGLPHGAVHIDVEPVEEPAAAPA